MCLGVLGLFPSSSMWHKDLGRMPLPGSKSVEMMLLRLCHMVSNLCETFRDRCRVGVFGGSLPRGEKRLAAFPETAFITKQVLIAYNLYSRRPILRCVESEMIGSAPVPWNRESVNIHIYERKCNTMVHVLWLPPANLTECLGGYGS